MIFPLALNQMHGAIYDLVFFTWSFVTLKVVGKSVGG